MFLVSIYKGIFSIIEMSNSKNIIEIFPGEISENAMKAIAYKILTMTETDKVQ